MKPDQEPPKPTATPLPPRYTRAQAHRFANPPKRPAATKVSPSLRQTDTSVQTGQARNNGQRMIDACKPPRYAIPPGYPKKPTTGTPAQ